MMYCNAQSTVGNFFPTWMTLHHATVGHKTKPMTYYSTQSKKYNFFMFLQYLSGEGDLFPPCLDTLSNAY